MGVPEGWRAAESAGLGAGERAAVRISNDALIRACLEGDQWAWERLLRRYERLLYGIALRCGLSPDDAADVYQIVCLRLVEHLGQMDHTGGLTRWLISTTVRESWRLKTLNVREAGLRKLPPDDAAAAGLGVPQARGALPEEELLRLEEEQLVRTAMEELGERCRILLRLLFQSGPAPSYRAIARYLDIPEPSVGVTRTRCLLQLKKILKKIRP
jgi:RNA polymerase sigma factor (sigma-70 family)